MNVRINFRFCLSMLMKLSFVWLIISIVASWSVYKIVEWFDVLMKWAILRIVHTNSITFNFVNQYLISIDVNILLKNKIESTFFLKNVFLKFSANSFFKWYNNISNSHLNAFTSTYKILILSKWVNQFDLLKFCCNCWKAFFFSKLNFSELFLCWNFFFVFFN